MGAIERFRRRGSFIARVRKQRLKYIAMLPSLITLLNGISGFIAIGFASKGSATGNERYFFHMPGVTYFALAGYMIFVAMIADALDGRVARLSKSTSSFGGQLDSLCDVISFGVAPAFLMLRMLDEKMDIFREIHPALGSLVTKFIWLAAAVYVSCAAIRLARFNVENEEDESAHMNFWGLPSPAAAGVVASIVVFHQDLLPELLMYHHEIYNKVDSIILYCLPLATFGAGLLMVTRIRYPHVFNQLFKGKKPFYYLIWGLMAIFFVLWNHQLMLLVAFCGFAVWGFARWLFRRRRIDEEHARQHENDGSIAAE
jgi:CDP-diacylglycerol--serine O-phosphatidyltransferase